MLNPIAGRSSSSSVSSISSSSSDAGGCRRLHAPTMSPPSETWDNDDDFDLSSLDGNTLELPRAEIDLIGGSDIGSKKLEEDAIVHNDDFLDFDREDHLDDWNSGFDDGEGHIDTLKVKEAGRGLKLILDQGDGGEDWDAGFAEDEDKTDTLKLSDLNSKALASAVSSKVAEMPTTVSVPINVKPAPDAHQIATPSSNPPPARSSTPSSGSRSRKRRQKRKQPILIRNLGGPSTVPRVEGSMRWNPTLYRWEGNEEEARSFEDALRGTNKSVLAHKLSMGNLPTFKKNQIPSRQDVGRNAGIAIRGTGENITNTKAPNRMTFRTVQGTLSNPQSPPPVGAKVVGDMIFDPVRLCWLNKNREDEVDPFATMNDDSDDEDYEQTKKGKEASSRSSKPTKSAATASRLYDSSSTQSRVSNLPTSERQWTVGSISRVIRGPKKLEVPDSLANRIPITVWKDCLAAKTRHDEELAGFLPTRQLSHIKRRGNPVRDRNSHLYLIQKLAKTASQ